MNTTLQLTLTLALTDSRKQKKSTPGSSAAMTDLIGHQLGNYRLIRLLGHGGFADVYLGEHIHLNTLAAIKMLDARLTGDEITQFRNEARTIARLEHPHIVRVLDFGVEDLLPFLVMNYAPNGTSLGWSRTSGSAAHVLSVALTRK